ncbi:MAG: hypothetical protein ACKN9I_00085 [Alphaproteobacteria bacterium]
MQSQTLSNSDQRKQNELPFFFRLNRKLDDSSQLPPAYSKDFLGIKDKNGLFCLCDLNINSYFYERFLGCIFMNDNFKSLFDDEASQVKETEGYKIFKYFRESDEPITSNAQSDKYLECFEDFVLYGNSFFIYNKSDEKFMLPSNHTTTYDVYSLDYKKSLEILKNLYDERTKNKFIPLFETLNIDDEKLSNEDKDKIFQLFATNKRFQDDFIDFVEKTIAIGPGIIGAGNDYLKDDTMKQIRGILASDLLKKELGIDKIEAISSGLLSLIRPDKVGQAESSTPTTTPESAKTQPKSPAQATPRRC